MLARALNANGFFVLPSLLSREECGAICRLLPAADALVGTRNLLAEEWCGALARRIRASPELVAALPPGAAAVQCTFFAKSSEKNWSVPFHRDLSIPVRSRVDSPRCKGWSEKEGVLYTQPPAEVLEELVAVRIHLDDCESENGPLKVYPGSHALGPGDLPAALECVGPAGSAVVMKPLLIHGSSKASAPTVRRVLHFLFGPRRLPYGLEWNKAI